MEGNAGKLYVSPRSSLAFGTIVAGRYRIQELVASSSYSHVYRAVDTKTDDEPPCCLKVERLLEDKQHSLLRHECNVILKLKDTKLVPRVLAFSSHEKSVEGGSLLVLELFGDDLRKHLRRHGQFSPQTTAFLGLQMLKVLQRFHKCGYIHNDVKLANFVFGRHDNDRLKVYAIDFGLARKHLDNDGLPKPPRETCNFRGTTMYASLATHALKDLGRVDDLWSLLFAMIELVTGQLPWAGILRGSDQMNRSDKKKVKRRVYEVKKTFVRIALGQNPRDAMEQKEFRSLAKYLDRRVPKPLVDFLKNLHTLQYESEPDYAALRACLGCLGSPAELLQAAGRELLGEEALDGSQKSKNSSKKKRPSSDDRTRLQLLVPKSAEGEERLDRSQKSKKRAASVTEVEPLAPKAKQKSRDESERRSGCKSKFDWLSEREAALQKQVQAIGSMCAEVKMALLDGEWTQKNTKEASISDTCLTFVDGSKVTISKDVTGKKFSMNWNGDEYMAELQNDGKLHWSDGDIWERLDQAPEALLVLETPNAFDVIPPLLDLPPKELPSELPSRSQVSEELLPQEAPEARDAIPSTVHVPPEELSPERPPRLCIDCEVVSDSSDGLSFTERNDGLSFTERSGPVGEDDELLFIEESEQWPSFSDDHPDQGEDNRKNPFSGVSGFVQVGDLWLPLAALQEQPQTPEPASGEEDDGRIAETCEQREVETRIHGMPERSRGLWQLAAKTPR